LPTTGGAVDLGGEGGLEIGWCAPALGSLDSSDRLLANGTLVDPLVGLARRRVLTDSALASQATTSSADLRGAALSLVARLAGGATGSIDRSIRASLITISAYRAPRTPST